MVCKNGDIYGFLGAWWVLINMVPCKQGVSGEFDWVRFLVVIFLYKTNANPQKKIAVGKKRPNCHF